MATGVLPSQLMQFATIPVDDNYGKNRFTAYALANPGNQNLTVQLALVDQNGHIVDDTVSITLSPGQQVARYLYQDLNRAVFNGSVVFRAQAGGAFVAAALVQNEQFFTVIPVIPGKAPGIPN